MSQRTVEDELKLGSHRVVKWARALPSRKVVVITTSCELMVVRVVVVHALMKWGCEISNSFQSYS